MSQEADLIAQIKGLLDDLEPEAAGRVINYFATTYRDELRQEAAKPARIPESDEEKAKRPSFLQTEARIERGEVMLELERRGLVDKKKPG